MTTAVQRRRGTSTEHATFTGLDGEITVNTTTYTAHIHDGATVGGVPLAKADGSNIVTSSIDINGGTIDGTVIGGSTAAAITGTTITGTSFVSSGDMTFGDNDKALFGAGSDLQIYHNGSKSIIHDFGTGNLEILADDFVIKNSTGVNTLFFADAPNGQVSLYHSNAAKLSTTATGIDVTGNLTVDAGSNGKIEFGDITTNYGRLYADSTGTFVGSVTADPLIFRTTNTERMRIDASGNVGIGVSTPLGKLHSSSATSGATPSANGNQVVAENSGNAGITIASGATSLGNIFFADSGDNADGYIQYDQSGRSMRFGTATSEAMRIDSSGNVGIGVSSPSDSLHLKNDSSYQLRFDSSGANKWRLGAGWSGFYEDSFLISDTTAGNRLVIDSSGNVGIGTNSPTANLVVTQSGNTPTSGFSSSQWQGCFVNTGTTTSIARVGIYSGNATTALLNFGDADDADIGGLAYDNSDNSLAIRTNNAEAMRINSSGNVGIGTSSPQAPLHARNGSSGVSSFISGTRAIIEGTATTYLTIAAPNTSVSGILFADPDDSDNGFIKYDHSASGVMSFGSAGTERMRIDSAGNLLVGTTSATGSGASSGKQVIQFNGAAENGIYFDDTRTAAGTSVAAIFGRGSTAVGRLDTTLTSVALTSLSDERVKNNIVDAPSASDDIDAIQVRSFDWKSDGSHQKYGMVAQELMTVAPEAVSVPEDPEQMMGVDYSKLVPMMLKEIQSLRARVAQLEGAN
jgi:hypothetical protein